MRKIYSGFTFITLFICLQASAQKVVGFKDDHIQYMGRIAYQADAAKMFWSGSWITVNFNGTEAKVDLKDERGDNYFDVIIDGKIVVLHPDAQKRTYTLATGLKAGRIPLRYLNVLNGPMVLR